MPEITVMFVIADVASVTLTLLLIIVFTAFMLTYDPFTVTTFFCVELASQKVKLNAFSAPLAIDMFPGWFKSIAEVSPPVVRTVPLGTTL